MIALGIRRVALRRKASLEKIFVRRKVVVNGAWKPCQTPHHATGRR